MGPKNEKSGGAPKGGAPKGGAPKGGAPKGGAQKGGAQKGGGPKGGGPKFRSFFSLSRHNFLSFFTLLGVLSWNFGGVFEALAFGVLGPFQGPGLQKHHQNSTKGPPREEERMKIVAGEGNRE